MCSRRASSTGSRPGNLSTAREVGAHRKVADATPLGDEPFALDHAERARVVRDAETYLQVAPEHAFLAGRTAAVVWRMFCDARDQPRDDLGHAGRRIVSPRSRRCRRCDRPHPSRRARPSAPRTTARDPRTAGGGLHGARQEAPRRAAAGLPEPALDHEVRDASGILQGDHHRTSRDQWLRDLRTYAAYARVGQEVVRITAAQARSAEGTDLVREALMRHGRRG